ncbi:MAG TPA: hypothetical protein VN819_04245 [Thermoplasmata archaeon]|nr:hypothetical protein [Thermoplasmata archaeon]
MTPRGGRPRTFDPAIVPLAVERHERGETWVEIALDLKVGPGTLRARASDYRRVGGAHKTPASRPDDTKASTESSAVPNGARGQEPAT